MYNCACHVRDIDSVTISALGKYEQALSLPVVQGKYAILLQ